MDKAKLSKMKLQLSWEMFWESLCGIFLTISTSYFIYLYLQDGKAFHGFVAALGALVVIQTQRCHAVARFKLWLLDCFYSEE